MPEPTKNVDQIFWEALQIEDPEQRDDFVRQHCGEDQEQHRLVENLIKAQPKVDRFLEKPFEFDVTAESSSTAEQSGSRVGPYKLLQKLGEGGMGEVYMAEQTEPVERRVALKIVKLGMDTRQVIARFEAERQALAMMDHPNIATVLDAGTTDSGRPYFVMELIKAVPITQYCDEHRLDPRQRLELFQSVCQGVQHAHQKGIIHRDLKPSNVMVAEYDDVAVPKIIDFGVAKATQQRLTEKTMFTEVGTVVGTIEYMSPEQAKLNQLDIDTRSDIYSLGVLLYELLTGEMPFDRNRLRLAALDEMLRIIREEEPSRPSIKISTSESLPSIAANRTIEPKRLSALVRGELDWIVMKALEKDRSRRYETATGLVDDIQRYFDDEAVVACPPSAGYRFRKFARRNRGALSMVAVVSAALLLGIVGTTWQAVRVTKQRNRAVIAEELARKQVERADRATEKARTEAAIAKAVNDFVNKDLLGSADPYAELNRDLKVREVLDRASQEIEGRFEDQVLVKAQILQTLGWVYSRLGEYGVAKRHLKQSLQLYQQKRGMDHPNTLAVAQELASVYCDEGQFEQARLLLEKTKLRSLGALGPENPRTLSLTNDMAAVDRSLGHYAEAEKLHRQVLGIQLRVQGIDHPDTLSTMHSLAIVIHELGRSAEAEAIYRQVLKLEDQLGGEEHPKTLEIMSCMAFAIDSQGRHEEAEKLCREVIEVKQRVLGEEHHRTLASMINLAVLVRGQGRCEEAEKLNREVLEILRRVLPPEHPDTLKSMHNLAMAIADQERYEEAEKLNRNVLEIRSRLLPPEHPDLLKSMHNLAMTIADQERYQEAEKLNRMALAVLRRTLPPEHPDTLRSIRNLANVVFKQGHFVEAESLHRELVDVFLRTRGEEHPDTQMSKRDLAAAIAKQAGAMQTGNQQAGELVGLINNAPLSNTVGDERVHAETAALLGIEVDAENEKQDP